MLSFPIYLFRLSKQSHDRKQSIFEIVSHENKLEWIQVHKDILQQRRILLDIGNDNNTIELYDKQWGIISLSDHDEIDILDSTQTSIEDEMIYSDNKATQLAKDLRYYTKHHAGLALMNLFILDLLGRNTEAAKIFQHKFELDFEKSHAVSYHSKVIAVLMLLGVNGFFIYYILLKAFVKGYAWQNHFVWSYIFQILIDVLIIETIGKFILIISMILSSILNFMMIIF